MNNCGGIKILDLPTRKKLTQNEYLVIAERGSNYKVDVKSLISLVGGVSEDVINELKAYIDNADKSLQLQINNVRNQTEIIDGKVDDLIDNFYQYLKRYIDNDTIYADDEHKVIKAKGGSGPSTKTFDITVTLSDADNGSVSITGTEVLKEVVTEGEPSGPSFHQSLVDAWFMSGPSNSDKPSSITGVMGNEMILKNFDFTSESGFGKGVYDGALVFDGVNDYGICTGLPILDDYTLICKREWIDLSRKSNAAIANKRKVNQTLGGAFNFERLTTSQILTLSFGNYTNIQLSSSGVVYQTKTSYNGDKVISSGSLTDTDSLFLGCSGNGIEFANCAIYYFALYNKSLTPEEIETEKERLNEEWLKRKTE